MAGLGLLLGNAALIACFIIRRRAKGNIIISFLTFISFKNYLYFIVVCIWVYPCHHNLINIFLFSFPPYAEVSTQNSKSATIEMYAPSSYNDTVTGETLSSVSEKSDSYSNEGSQPDYMVS